MTMVPKPRLRPETATRVARPQAAPARAETEAAADTPMPYASGADQAKGAPAEGKAPAKGKERPKRAAPRGNAGRAHNRLPAGVAALAPLMPLHLVLSAAGRVLATGPTLRRLFPGERVIGRELTALFDIRDPLRRAGAGALSVRVGEKLHLSPRIGPGVGLRMCGAVVPVGEEGAVLLNLSFGVDVVRAVGLLQLTDADFAATDLALELLFTAEANSAVMAEMRAMSARIDGARMQAQEEAMTDPLTRLRNRRACDSFLARQCREGAAFGLLHIDLDYFKQVNDRLGHAAGDRVLVKVAEVLRHEARAMDCLARVGGDEFVIILPGLMDTARLTALAEMVIEGVSRPIPVQGEVARISASIGMVQVEAGLRPDPAQVLATADVALYAAKEAGRGRVVLADDMGLALTGPAGSSGPTDTVVAAPPRKARG